MPTRCARIFLKEFYDSISLCYSRRYWVDFMIVSLIVSLVVIGLIYWLVSLLPLPHPFGVIVQVLFVILAIVLVLSAFGVIPAGSIPFNWRA